MTREEAITELKRYMRPDHTVPEEIKMAISALEQEFCGSAISREAVNNFICQNYREWFVNDKAFMECLDNLKQLPSVQPSSRKGYWIHFAQSDDCSECGYSTGKYESPSNFCPNCGCRMVGDTE